MRDQRIFAARISQQKKSQLRSRTAATSARRQLPTHALQRVARLHGLQRTLSTLERELLTVCICVCPLLPFDARVGDLKIHSVCVNNGH